MTIFILALWSATKLKNHIILSIQFLLYFLHSSLPQSALEPTFGTNAQDKRNKTRIAATKGPIDPALASEQKVLILAVLALLSLNPSSIDWTPLKAPQNSAVFSALLSIVLMKNGSSHLCILFYPKPIPSSEKSILLHLRSGSLRKKETNSILNWHKQKKNFCSTRLSAIQSWSIWQRYRYKSECR